MAIRLIAFDLDDTLLDSGGKVARGDIEAIKKARDRGIHIVPASGRRYNSMTNMLEAIGHSGLAITLNGARVVNHPGETPLYERFVDAGLCLEVIGEAKRLGAYLQLYVGEDFEFEKAGAHSELYSALSGAGGGEVGDLASFLRKANAPSKKLLFIERDETKMRRLQDAMNERFGGRLSIFRSKPIYLELTHLEATKGAALAACCAALGVDPSEAMAIGDGENDMAMLTLAGVGVAMGNASDAIKSKVGNVTATNDECGVAKAICEYAL